MNSKSDLMNLKDMETIEIAHLGKIVSIRCEHYGVGFSRKRKIEKYYDFILLENGRTLASGSWNQEQFFQFIERMEADGAFASAADAAARARIEAKAEKEFLQQLFEENKARDEIVAMRAPRPVSKELPMWAEMLLELGHL